MIGRLREKIVYATSWWKVNDLEGRNDYQSALKLLDSLPPSIRADSAIKLKRIHLLGLLKLHSETLRSALEIIAPLSEKADRSEDAKFFLVFAQWYGLVAFRNLNPSAQEPESLLFDMSSLNLRLVSARWKRNFPMPIHPDWRHG